MQYRRLIIPGTSYFFSVVLQDRRSDLLIRRINELRQAFKQVIERYPFIIDGIVVLPDHFHLMMTLPPDDTNYSRGKASENEVFGNAGFGNMLFGTNWIILVIWITSTTCDTRSLYKLLRRIATCTQPTAPSVVLYLNMRLE